MLIGIALIWGIVRTIENILDTNQAKEVSKYKFLDKQLIHDANAYNQQVIESHLIIQKAELARLENAKTQEEKDGILRKLEVQNETVKMLLFETATVNGKDAKTLKYRIEKISEDVEARKRQLQNTATVTTTSTESEPPKAPETVTRSHADIQTKSLDDILNLDKKDS